MVVVAQTYVHIAEAQCVQHMVGLQYEALLLAKSVVLL